MEASLLQQLLGLVAGGGLSTVEEMARCLSVSRSLLEAMLEELARLGYLRRVASECTGHCAGCPMGGCSVDSRGRAWALTEAGARAASQGARNAALH